MENHINEAIILAGGLGTRLKSELGDLPKPMAPVHNQPFLAFLLDYLKKQNIERVILSVGYAWKKIEDYFGSNYRGIELVYIVEETPLGTGGGIRLALQAAKSDQLFILNGDSYFEISLIDLEKFHQSKNAECTLALRELENVDRFGMVEMDGQSKISAFIEKQFRAQTVINGGIYCVNKNFLDGFEPHTKFSFEQDYLEKETASKNLYGKIFNSYFIDIGIPEDYKQFIKDMQ